MREKTLVIYEMAESAQEKKSRIWISILEKKRRKSFLCVWKKFFL